MAQRFEGDPGRYVAVLRGFGLSDSEIRRLHGPGTDSNTALERLVADHVEGDPTEALVETLCSSPYGMDLPRFYSSLDAAEAIERVSNAHGYDASVEPDGGSAFSVTVTDPLSGQTEEFRIEYPDTELGPDNFPAALAAIERVVFSDAGLAFVLLSTDARWQSALVEQSAVDGLTDQFGPRIAPFETPILTPERPVDYVRNPPLAGTSSRSELEAPSTDDLATWLETVTNRPTEEVIESLQDGDTTVTSVGGETADGPADGRSATAVTEDTAGADTTPGDSTAASADLAHNDASVPKSDTDDAVEPDADGQATEATPDDVDDAFPADGEESSASTTSGRSVRIEDDDRSTGIDDVDPAAIDELSASGPERHVSENDDVDSAALDEFAANGPERHVSEGDDDVFDVLEDEDDESDETNDLSSGATKTISTQGIDDVFEELEQQAPDPGIGGATTDRVSDDDPVDSVTPADPDESEDFGGGPDKTVSEGSVDDILDTAAQSFETFVGEGAETHIDPDPDAVLPDADDGDVMTAIEEADADHSSPEAELKPDDPDGLMASIVRDEEDEDEDEGGLDRTIGLSDRVAEQLSSDDDDQSDSDRSETSGQSTDTDETGAEDASPVDDHDDTDSSGDSPDTEASAEDAPTTGKSDEGTPATEASNGSGPETEASDEDTPSTETSDEGEPGTETADEDADAAPDENAEDADIDSPGDDTDAVEDAPTADSQPATGREPADPEADSEPSESADEPTTASDEPDSDDAAGDSEEPWATVDISDDEHPPEPSAREGTLDDADEPDEASDSDWRTGPNPFEVDDGEDDDGVLDLSDEAEANRKQNGQSEDTAQTSGESSDSEDADDDGVVDRLRSFVSR